jgi:hypothetical protein
VVSSIDTGLVRALASGLLLVVHGLIRPADPRAALGVDATIAALGCGPLLYRYEPDGRDGFDPGEAPFVPASWWAVAALAVLGRPDAAVRAEQLCATLPRLQPEEFDPTRGEALGNNAAPVVARGGGPSALRGRPRSVQVAARRPPAQPAADGPRAQSSKPISLDQNRKNPSWSGPICCTNTSS